jgi:predicted RNase H-like HicB family nuclease
MKFDDPAKGKHPFRVNYIVILEKESVGGYHAFCPALKGCHSEGETEIEAFPNIREAMEVYLESLAAHNEPIRREEIA